MAQAAACVGKTQRPFAITLSRQTGSGAHCVPEALVSYLQPRTPETAPVWTVFDQNLVSRRFWRSTSFPRGSSILCRKIGCPN